MYEKNYRDNKNEDEAALRCSMGKSSRSIDNFIIYYIQYNTHWCMSMKRIEWLYSIKNTL